MTDPVSPLVLLAGPTASGKSRLALALAERLDGTVINADSAQVYRDLRIVSARPSEHDEARAPHRLYGVLDGGDVCSAARWADMAAAEVHAAWTAGRLPLVVGGTGLYMQALTEGLAAIPDIPPDVRAAARARLAARGTAAFHAELAARDPEMAARLDPGNSQRLARAWEVLEATGRSLAWWQRQPPAPPPLRARTLTVVLDPPRDALNAVIDARVEAMRAAGALDEVAALLARRLPPDRPVMRAVGVPHLAAHLRGDLTLPEAVARMQAATRQYAKRQRTWLRHRTQADVVAQPIDPAQFSESLFEETFANVRRFLLTP
ncbi:tRNA (adenosine(37)-N6)-dimethylallyltransferase MiaA [Roseospira navarrensis]|uniref:tRNA dimethylallyltransferase n=1 Tax=Roseospira navarrensis TaxID=140058 RepID=A0A7X2D2W5_9PROT|nr:tRNA (adenosine(37)-N6)-dimethylallyltransferase MiaA [Roseospira navarrensis]MQX34972.1 tRNA (adenosine(37)-N6)-dimethylallyltransferase MiaA [Roseospira navarrensis]